MDNNLIGEVVIQVVNTSFDEEFVKLVFDRLESLGYTPQSTDLFTISFSIAKVDSDIKNKCNTLSVPKDLHIYAVDMVCGEVLFSLCQSGKLKDTFNLEAAVQSVQVGDTNVSYAMSNTLTESQRLDLLINTLLNSGKDVISCFRKMRW